MNRSVSDSCHHCFHYDRDCFLFDSEGEDEVDAEYVADDKLEEMEYIADVPDGEYNADVAQSVTGHC